MESQTDEDVVVLVQHGDDEAFATLMRRYEQKLLRYARTFLFYDPSSAEDVVQEVFLKAYANIRSFDATRRFSPWIYRIAHNQLINTIKKRRKEPLPFFDPDTLFPHPVARETADRDLNEQEFRDALEHSLKQIDAKYREVLVLYYFQELDYNEIAEILRIPRSTVGVRLKRAREAMRKILKNDGDYARD